MWLFLYIIFSHLASTNVSHIAQSSDAVHADHVVLINLSTQKIVHDLFSKIQPISAYSRYHLQRKKKHS